MFTVGSEVAVPQIRQPHHHAPSQYQHHKQQRHREQERQRLERESRRYQQRMRVRVQDEMEITIEHCRRVLRTEGVFTRLEVILEWLLDDLDAFLQSREERMVDPMTIIYRLRKLRRMWPICHDSSRDESEEGLGDPSGRIPPGMADQERDLTGRQTIMEAAEHEPGEAGIPGGEGREATAKNGRSHTELIELERYRGQAVDGRLEAVSSVLGREGVEHDGAPCIVNIYKAPTMSSSKSISKDNNAALTVSPMRRIEVSRTVYRLEDGAFQKVENFMRWLGLLW
jgi:hypothetical protein